MYLARLRVRDSNITSSAPRCCCSRLKDPEADIYLYINSPGGSVTAGIISMTPCSSSRTDVVTASMGPALQAPSASYATPNARILMHQPLGGDGCINIRTQAELILVYERSAWRRILSAPAEPGETILKDN